MSDWDEVAASLKKSAMPLAGSGPAVTDNRGAGQVAIDQAKAVLGGAGMPVPSSLGAPVVLPQAVQALTHPVDTVTSLAKALTLAIPKGASGAVDAAKSVTPALMKLLAEAEGFKNTDGLPTASFPEMQQGATGAGQFAAAIPVVEGARGLGGAAADAMPNATRAGNKLGQIRAAAENVPTDPTSANAVIARAQELTDAGHGPLSAGMRKYVTAQKPTAGNFMGAPIEMGADPINYPESFDFASAAKKLSSRESSAQTGMMKSQVKQFAGALQDANRAAADQVGMGQMFDDAMKEYRQAKTIENATAVAKKYALRATLTTALLGAGGAAAYEIIGGRK